MTNEFIFFSLFIISVMALLMLDLLVIGKGSHEVSIREASIWSAIWITLALGFAVFLRFFVDYVHGIENFSDLQEFAKHYAPYLRLNENDFAASLEIYKKDATINYLSGYLIEKSLSIDNLFVIMAVLTGFSVKKTDYKGVLFWGIIGAIVMRAIFIFAGAALIDKFEWLLYIFGIYLIYIGISMYIKRNKETKVEPQNHSLVKFLSKRLKVFPRYVNGRFFIKKDGIRYITPLFIVLIIIEFTDLVFAMDSIPAIFAVTRDPYIVFFSNIFAILGLRSLFFLLMKVVDRFYLLKVGVSFLLVFIGTKLMLHGWLEEFGFKSVHSLYIILIVLFLSVVLSVIFPKKNRLIVNEKLSS